MITQAVQAAPVPAVPLNIRAATGVRVRVDNHFTVQDQDSGCHPPPAVPSPGAPGLPDASEVQHECQQDHEPRTGLKDDEYHDPLACLPSCCR